MISITVIIVLLRIKWHSFIIKGVVERISYPIQADTEVGSVMQYAIITVRGTRQPVISDITSVMTPGISAFGIMRYGA